MLETLHIVVLAAVVVAGAWTDVRTARIPNALTVTGLLAGLALAAAGGTIASCALAAAVALALGFPLFRARVLGGGDVKLLLAVGALLGLERFLVALALAALSGAALSLVVALRRGVLLPVLLNSKDMLLSWATPGSVRPAAAASSGVGVPYGVAIAVGALAAWVA